MMRDSRALCISISPIGSSMEGIAEMNGEASAPLACKDEDYRMIWKNKSPMCGHEIRNDQADKEEILKAKAAMK